MMTEQKISEMTSEELDRAVAVEVMEWKWQESAKIFMDKEGQVILGGRHWSPSTSPTDAVIDKIIERFGGIWGLEGDKDGWEVTYGRHGKFNKNRNRAVCEIALETVREATP